MNLITVSSFLIKLEIEAVTIYAFFLTTPLENLKLDKVNIHSKGNRGNTN